MADPASPESLLRELVDAFPIGCVKADALYRHVYARDASCFSYLPEAVARIGDVQQVQRLFAIARRHATPVTVRAAGTSLCGQALGTGIIAELRLGWKSAQVLDDGGRVRCEPGLTVAEVDHLLEPFGRKLGPDPESGSAAMMGGVLANNSGGRLSGVAADAYHTLDVVEFVLPNGHHYDSGRPDDRERFAREDAAIHDGVTELRDRVRADAVLVERIRRKYQIKNAMGYRLDSFVDFDDPLDILAHLLIGSEGTLAFVASATLATLPLNRYAATGLLLLEHVAAAVAAMAPLAEAGAATLELMDGGCLAAWRSQRGAPDALAVLGPDAAALLVEFEAPTADALAALLPRASATISSLGAVLPEPLATDPTTKDRWRGLRSGMYPLLAATRPPGDAVFVEDVAVPPDRLTDLIAGLHALFAENGYADDAVVFGHAASGNIHFLIHDDLGRPVRRRTFERFMDGLADLVLGMDGSLKAEHGTGRAMAPFLEREWGADAYALMRDLKRLVDPDGIMNPGVILNDDPGAHTRHVKASPTLGDAVVDRCVECGFCERVCPTRLLTLTPRQRVAATRSRLTLIEEGSDAEAAALSRAFTHEGRETCVADGLCATVCPAGVNVAYLTDHQRAETRSTTSDRIMGAAARRFSLVEEGVRGAVSVGHDVDALLGEDSISRITAVARRLLPGLPQWPHGLAKAPPRAYRDPADPKLVYFPACISRIAGSSPGGKGSLAETVLRVADRAGIDVRLPKDVEGLCCGQIWGHKGYRAGQAIMANRLVEAMWRWSEGGRLPIMCDVASCTRTMLVELERETYGSRERLLSDENCRRYRHLEILDLVQWLHRDVMIRLDLRHRKSSVVVHPTCACTELGTTDQIRSIAAACADSVTIPFSLGCCGAGGDRGFRKAGLADAATRDERRELEGRTFDGAYSFARTCEIVLSNCMGRQYESLAYLVDEASDPESGRGPSAL